MGLLYEGRHLSLSVRRKITVNVFYSTFTNVFFYFCHVFTFLMFFFILGGTFFSSMDGATCVQRNMEAQKQVTTRLHFFTKRLITKVIIN